MIENPPADSTDVETEKAEESTLVETEHKTQITQSPLPLPLSFENIILIPYRNRKVHLDYFIEHTVPLIVKNMPTTRVIVIEQIEGKLFNRGKLLNVGFTEYKDKCNYFITHDVDINPTEPCLNNYYSPKTENNIRGILVSPKVTLAPIVKIPHNLIFKMNGFPNDIWGWGVEDKVLEIRRICCKINKDVIFLNKDKNRNDKHFKMFNDISDRNKSQIKHNSKNT